MSVRDFPIIRTESNWKAFMAFPTDRFVRSGQVGCSRDNAYRWSQEGFLLRRQCRKGKLRWNEFKRLVDLPKPTFGRKEPVARVKCQTPHGDKYWLTQEHTVADDKAMRDWSSACSRIGSLAALVGQGI